MILKNSKVILKIHFNLTEIAMHLFGSGLAVLAIMHTKKTKNFIQANNNIMAISSRNHLLHIPDQYFP